MGKGYYEDHEGSLVKFKAEKMNNLYLCHVESVSIVNSSIDAIHEDMTILWHNRLGHMSNKGDERLKVGAFGDDVLSSMPYCDSCILGQQQKVNFHVTTPSMIACT